MRKRKTHAIDERNRSDRLMWASLCGLILCESSEAFGVGASPVTRPTCLICKRALAARKGNK